MRLLDAAEALNHRLCDYYGKTYNRETSLLDVQGDYVGKEYYSSTVYRFLALFAWIRIVEKDIVYFDTMHASKEDKQYITFLKVFPFIFCGGGGIFSNSGIDLKDVFYGDRFYRNDFETMSDYLINQEKSEVCPYRTPKENFTQTPQEVARLLRFFDGLCVSEVRYRWDLLQLLHFTLIAFLNTFGFEHQKLDLDRIQNMYGQHRRNKLLQGYNALLNRYKLDKAKQVQQVVDLLSEHHAIDESYILPQEVIHF